MTIHSQTILRRSSDALSTEMDGEAVLMSISCGKYLTLDSVGTVIWARLETSQSLQDLQEQLVESFVGEPEIIYRESLEFIEKLHQYGLINSRSSEMV